MKTNLKIKAIELRKAGYPYQYILSQIKVSKSTLSNWLTNVPYTPNETTLKHISRARDMALKTIQENKLASIETAKKEAENYLGRMNQRDLFILGLGIYIGEGTKTQNLVRIVNSDPRIIKIMIRWFKEVCGLDDSNLRPRLHIYPDTNKHNAVRFWSKELSLNEAVFQKPCVDKRSNKSIKGKGKLPYGTLHLSVVSNGRKEFGVYLFRKICSWIDCVLG